MVKINLILRLINGFQKHDLSNHKKGFNFFKTRTFLIGMFEFYKIDLEIRKNNYLQ